MDKVKIIPPTSSLLKAYQSTKFLAKIAADPRYVEESQELVGLIRESFWVDLNRGKMKDFGGLR